MMPNRQPRPAASHNPQPEQLTGLAERVTFHSDESGYRVLRIKARGHRDLVTVVGTLTLDQLVKVRILDPQLHKPL